MVHEEANNVFEDVDNQKLINHYTAKYRGNTLLYETLRGEGLLALWEASKHYDPTKGAKFTTFASVYVNGYIYKALSEMANVVPLPKNVFHELKDYKTNLQQLEKKLGRTATENEIADALKLTIYNVRKFNLALKTSGALSLDATEDAQGEELSLDEILPDTTEGSPLEKLAAAEKHDKLWDAIHELAGREQRILLQLFGLNGIKKRTLASIAKDEGITTARCSQIKNGAIKKLRTVLHQKGFQEKECA